MDPGIVKGINHDLCFQYSSFICNSPLVYFIIKNKFRKPIYTRTRILTVTYIFPWAPLSLPNPPPFLWGNHYPESGVLLSAFFYF